MRERCILSAKFISYDVARSNKFIEYVNKNKITFEKDAEGNINKEDVRSHLKNFFQSLGVPIDSKDLIKQPSNLDTFFDIDIHDDGFRDMSSFIKYKEIENLKENASLLHVFKQTTQQLFLRHYPP